ncbi:hypothetical protein E2C01_056612 [Portunus trituberculatus]|uniref:Uncharacterized protein n=1 Tax=Portunus trituberculatus TaxID=210409 RepID=A0A5B7GZN9_PORTR|nr:hypothetical protein [Portunus trituberculatus]
MVASRGTQKAVLCNASRCRRPRQSARPLFEYIRQHLSLTPATCWLWSISQGRLLLPCRGPAVVIVRLPWKDVQRQLHALGDHVHWTGMCVTAWSPPQGIADSLAATQTSQELRGLARQEEGTLRGVLNLEAALGSASHDKVAPGWVVSGHNVLVAPRAVYRAQPCHNCLQQIDVTLTRREVVQADGRHVTRVLCLAGRGCGRRILGGTE